MIESKIKRKDLKNIFNFIFHIIKNNKISVIPLLIISILRTIESVIWSIPIKKIIDVLTESDRSAIMHDIKWPFVWMIVAFVAIEGIWRIWGVCGALLTKPAIERYAHEELTKYVLNKRYSEINSKSSSIVNRINMTSFSIREIIFNGVANILSYLVGSVVIIISIFVVNKQIGLICLLYMCTHLAYAGVFLKKFNRISQKASKSKDILNKKMLNLFQNIDNVKEFNNERREILMMKVFRDRKQLQSKISMVFPEKIKLFFSINSIIIVGFVVFISLLKMFAAEEISISDFNYCFRLASSALIYGLAMFTTFLTFAIEQFGEVSDSIKFFYGMKNEENPGDSECKVQSGNLEFKNVCFSYEGKKILDNVSFKIGNTERVAVIGKSGSGKSTILKLVSGLIMQQKGQILIDGKPVSKIDMTSRRSSISSISQSSNLFNRTIKDNIAYGTDVVNVKKIVKAVRMSRVSEFVSNIIGGLGFSVKSNGGNLSGGQKQRVAIARAFMKDAKIILADEITSALDKKNESFINKNLLSFSKNKTLIMTTHKFNLMDKMDKIIILDNGKVKAIGCHSDLLKKSSFYRKLIGENEKS